jgi:hypothetical protein
MTELAQHPASLLAQPASLVRFRLAPSLGLAANVCVTRLGGCYVDVRV